jgi:hypothetical protein
MNKINIFLLVFVLGFASFANADDKICTKEEAMKAEMDTDNLKDWSYVYQSYNKYKHCDDGSISEGYTEKICHSLAYNWPHVIKLNKIVLKNNEFKKFVIKHIDDTANVNDVKKIFVNSTERCRPDTKLLCKSISKKICDMEKEINNFKAVTKSSILNKSQIDKYCR